MLDLLSLWPHSDFSSMGREVVPDGQFCLVVWHGPVRSADGRGDLLQMT